MKSYKHSKDFVAKQINKRLDNAKKEVVHKKAKIVVEPIVVPEPVVIPPEPEIVAPTVADGILEAIPEVKSVDFEFDLAYPKEKDTLKQKLALEEYIESPIYASKAVTAAGFELDKINKALGIEPVKSVGSNYRVIEALVMSEEQRILLFDIPISDMVRDNWIPIGGVSIVVKDEHHWKLIQALYKEK